MVGIDEIIGPESSWWAHCTLVLGGSGFSGFEIGGLRRLDSVTE